VRGPGGGYRLSRLGSDINVAQVVDAVSESIDLTRCKGKGDCQQGESCLTHYLWCDLSNQIHSFLENISLQSLVERQEIREISERQDGYAKNRINVVDSLIL
jgi:Rrf2 family iron-sulfur cluster assembly transcriptional regulator